MVLRAGNRWAPPHPWQLVVQSASCSCIPSCHGATYLVLFLYTCIPVSLLMLAVSTHQSRPLCVFATISGTNNQLCCKRTYNYLDSAFSYTLTVIRKFYCLCQQNENSKISERALIQCSSICGAIWRYSSLNRPRGNMPWNMPRMGRGYSSALPQCAWPVHAGVGAVRTAGLHYLHSAPASF